MIIHTVNYNLDRIISVKIFNLSFSKVLQGHEFLCGAWFQHSNIELESIAD
jgi:hypothetical protein